MRKSAIVKATLTGVTVLAIAGSTLVYAQQREGRDGPRGWQPSTEDMRAFGEARIAALRAGLALSAEQEKNWPAYEQAARDFAKQRLERRPAAAAGSATPPADPVDRMKRQAEIMASAAAGLKGLADATEPLYRSLDEAQKRRFAVLSGRMGQRGGQGPQQGPRHEHQFQRQDRPGFGPGRDGGPRNERFRRGGLDEQPFEGGQRAAPTRL